MVKKKQDSAGFTLIEVMIALVILAIALTGLLVAISTNIRNMNRLETQSIANIIAVNTLNEIQLGLTPSDHRRIFNYDWKIDTQITPLNNEPLQQIDVTVSREGLTQSTRVQGYAYAEEK